MYLFKTHKTESEKISLIKYNANYISRYNLTGVNLDTNAAFSPIISRSIN